MNDEDEKLLKKALTQISDFYLPIDDPTDGFIYPKSLSIKSCPFLFNFVEELLDKCKKKIDEVNKNNNGERYDEFAVKMDGYSYRGHIISTVEKTILALRKLPREVPTLTDLGFDPALKKILVSPSLNNGGLIMLCGEKGQGKSTTCAAAIKERMLKLGSFCITVEDPPEMPLHGTHGDGRCLQTETRTGAFADAMRGVARCYPTVSGSILYVGETRDAETASEVLKAAMNGSLIFTTMHANNVENGINRMISLAAEKSGQKDACYIMSSVFRVGIHQRLEKMRPRPGQTVNKKLFLSFLLSASHQTPVANKIRKNEINGLGTDIHQQKTILEQHGPQALLRIWE